MAKNVPLELRPSPHLLIHNSVGAPVRRPLPLLTGEGFILSIFKSPKLVVLILRHISKKLIGR